MTADTAFLIPQPGLTVLQPANAASAVPLPLPAEGALVELDTYWYRRLADGDVTQCKASAPASSSKPRRASSNDSTDGA
ncbi:DUF2635 domain-containing protein [Pseudoxanthomonas winnipegensis]|uniref:DUF2635 domain-containing protein n=1 Tax=Pseudoxanthomonas winnipegensis TaxID=2480810 RepID=UPI001039D4DC|nr:DUF2635 domain-containing protein [Pseudoxanthomonas winnipegensis]TBV76877.1 DUF2635 domain-containing protein [Pseudoxanthomonas winnipegensis]